MGRKCKNKKIMAASSGGKRPEDCLHDNVVTIHIICCRRCSVTCPLGLLLISVLGCHTNSIFGPF
ncbi:hypothetical protein INR49_002274 [Caranx melampygus]|nr:hypothetical protein INR49_002274 [Caranx melampygus]